MEHLRARGEGKRSDDRVVVRKWKTEKVGADSG